MTFHFTNFTISRIFRNFLAMIYIRECLLTIFAEFYFHKKDKKNAGFVNLPNLAKSNLATALNLLLKALIDLTRRFPKPLIVC